VEEPALEPGELLNSRAVPEMLARTAAPREGVLPEQPLPHLLAFLGRSQSSSVLLYHCMVAIFP